MDTTPDPVEADTCNYWYRGVASRTMPVALTLRAQYFHHSHPLQYEISLYDDTVLIGHLFTLSSTW